MSVSFAATGRVARLRQAQLLSLRRNPTCILQAHHSDNAHAPSFSTIAANRWQGSGARLDTQKPSRAPKSRDRGPPSKEDTQTDFAAMNMLGNTPPPATGIDAMTEFGFALSNNTKVAGSGIIILGGEVYKWRPWLRAGAEEGAGAGAGADAAPRESSESSDTSKPRPLTGKLLNGRGQWEPALHNRPWAVLERVWPKPDLLIIGTGPGIVPISPATRRLINEMGIRIEVGDTRNASSQYNLLATERGVGQVAAALVPFGWREEVPT